jgi:hypothetical protein
MATILSLQRQTNGAILRFLISVSFPYISTSSESNGLTGLTVGTTTVYEKPGSTSEYANLKSVTTEYDGGHTRKTDICTAMKFRQVG